MKLSMHLVAELLGVDMGEWFALKGRDHTGHVHSGLQTRYVITEAGLQHAMWESDKLHAIATGELRHCPLAQQEFHAICCGMLGVVRSNAKRCKYVLGYGITTKASTTSTEQSLF